MLNKFEMMTIEIVLMRIVIVMMKLNQFET
jgi:hypothetical protein